VLITLSNTVEFPHCRVTEREADRLPTAINAKATDS